eukprot:7068686-Pyramimonas_sp.AAC.1
MSDSLLNPAEVVRGSAGTPLSVGHPDGGCGQSGLHCYRPWTPEHSGARKEGRMSSGYTSVVGS